MTDEKRAPNKISLSRRSCACDPKAIHVFDMSGCSLESAQQEFEPSLIGLIWFRHPPIAGLITRLFAFLWQVRRGEKQPASLPFSKLWMRDIPGRSSPLPSHEKRGHCLYLQRPRPTIQRNRRRTIVIVLCSNDNAISPRGAYSHYYQPRSTNYWHFHPRSR